VNSEPSRVGFFEELCVALAHRWEPERLFVIFTAYFDESGAHKDSPTLVIAAFLGTARQWRIFERRIRGLQREYQFTQFHGKEFKAKSGEFKGWSDRKRFGLLSEITHLVRDNLTEGASVALEAERYIKEYREAPRPGKMTLDSHYGICFRHVLSHLIRAVEEKGWHHKLNVVLEDGHRNVGDAVRIFGEIKNELFVDFENDLLGTITIAQKRDSIALMAADFLAYVTYSEDAMVRDGGAPYRRADSIPANEAKWTRIRLKPNAFDLQREQFREGQRRKAAKRRSLAKKPRDPML
jgi:hypothetical protein